MELTKFKFCPECGKRNPPNLIECRFCEADLTGVAVADSEAASGQNPSPRGTVGSESAPAETELVRICDCGEANPPQARKCRACGDDLSDILPTPIKRELKAPSYELNSVDGAVSFAVDKSMLVVGREAEMKEYLSTKAYVSRRHMRLTVTEDTVLVENLSRTNKTYLNNTEISDGVPTAIKDGDEIGLGGKVVGDSRQDDAAYFVFRIKP